METFLTGTRLFIGAMAEGMAQGMHYLVAAPLFWVALALLVAGLIVYSIKSGFTTAASGYGTAALTVGKGSLVLVWSLVRIVAVVLVAALGIVFSIAAFQNRSN